ncbi:MAG: hypothetical protein LBL98_00535 [Ruminococcus sp.]|jgi:hypothetical protein|nr:hypothetical protein [Ruminococcus sp.]
MKKITAAVSAILLAGVMLTGCEAAKNNPQGTTAPTTTTSRVTTTTTPHPTTTTTLFTDLTPTEDLGE